MAGFSFVERLRGTFYRLEDPLRERAISLDIEAHVRRLRRPAFGGSGDRSVRAPLASVAGHIHAEGLADAPVQGTLGLDALGDRRIPYVLAFVGSDGRGYRFRGEKDLSWLAPVETLVVLPFSIGTEQGDVWTEVARGTLRAPRDKESLRALVRSLRASPF